MPDVDRASEMTAASDQSPWGSVVIDAIAELVVVVDSSARLMYANRRCEEVLGVDRDRWIGQSGLDIIHPDDQALAVELLVSAQATGSGVKEPVTYRLAHQNGSWIEVELIASGVERDGERFLVISSRPRSVSRPSTDILDEVAGRLSHMFDDAAIGMAQVSLAGRFLRINAQLAATLQSTNDDVSRRGVDEVLDHDDVDEFHRAWAGLVEGDDATMSVEARLVVAGSIVHTHVTGSIVDDRHGVPMYVALQVLDVTQRVNAELALRESETMLRAAQIELLHRSTHDPLTGLGNRALLDDVLADLDTDRRSGIAIAYLDLDGFKAVNDRYGHPTGDDVLVQVAARLRAGVRPADTLLRLGGDEFVLVARSIGKDAARVMVERVLETVAEPFRIGDVAIHIGASAGLVTARRSTAGAVGLLAEADRALYLAKQNGRRLVVAVDGDSTLARRDDPSTVETP